MSWKSIGKLLFVAGVFVGVTSAYVATFTKIDSSHLVETATMLIIGGLFISG